VLTAADTDPRALAIRLTSSARSSSTRLIARTST
jgi:hypothetical protein